MKKQNDKIIYVGFLAMLLVFLSACGGQNADVQKDSGVPEESQLITFTDALGQEVKVNHPQRVAILIGSFADVWVTAGGKDTIVAAADDTWTQFSLGLSDEVINLGSTRSINLEALIQANPDFIIASSNTTESIDLRNTFDQMGIPSAYFFVSTFDEYLQMLDICTRITGCRENYQRFGLDIKTQIEKTKDRIDETRPRVMYIRATGSSCKVKNSEGSVLGEMLQDMGCINIADSEKSLLENLSLESIVAADPDMIFVVLQGSDKAKAEAVLENALLSNPAWQTLTAVKNNRYYIMDQNLYNLKPNARWGEAYEQLAEILYPYPKG